MTKTKVKGSFVCSPVQKHGSDHLPDGDFLPFVRVENKKKRAPRGHPGRFRQQEYRVGVYEEARVNSASEFETSSSNDQDEEPEDEDENEIGMSGARSGFFDGETTNAKASAARRGSVRLKVTPSKFKEYSPGPAEKLPRPREQSPFVVEKPKSTEVKDIGSFITPAEKYYKKRSAMHLDESTSSKRQVIAGDHFRLMKPRRDQIIAPPSQQSNWDSREQLHGELKEALKVVKKIMKMEAAEPFNTPVDPVALGIPDYFDIIKKPMDLGTICKNLERGTKYRNSQDVYEDVQLVWTNCRSYNRKGDPILELLMRVKKNFMKYWTASGLYTEKTPGGTESKGSDVRQHSDELLQERMEDISNFDGKSHKFEELHNISVYKSLENKTKKKKEDQQDGFLKEYSGYTGHLAEGHDREYEKKFDGWEKPREKPGTIDITHRKNTDFQSTPSKSRRVSGTGHHKPDCSCVVCTGVRRKLAREGKLGNSADNNANATPNPQERLLVRLRTEGPSKYDMKKAAKGTGIKFKLGDSVMNKRNKTEFGEIYSAKQVEDTSTTSPIKQTKASPETVEDEEKVDVRVDNAIDMEAEDTKASDPEVQADTPADETVEEGVKDSSFQEIMSETNKEASSKAESAGIAPEEGPKETLAEEMEDREDAGHNDEQFVDAGDTETDRQEGGTRYYRASYEMPLRKMNASILQMGQKLFGVGSSWNRGHSLGRRSEQIFSENPIFTTVSSLLNNRHSVMLK